jgi:hypothetical protein
MMAKIPLITKREWNKMSESQKAKLMVASMDLGRAIIDVRRQLSIKYKGNKKK